MSIRKTWPFLLANVPMWPILWLLVFASLARVKLGYWPSYDHPDPGSLAFPWSILDAAALPLFICAPFAVLVSVAAAVHAWHRRRWEGRLLLLLLTPATFVLFVAWLRFDPGGLFEWWID